MQGLPIGSATAISVLVLASCAGPDRASWLGRNCDLEATAVTNPGANYWVDPSGDDANPCIDSAMPLAAEAKQTIAGGMTCLVGAPAPATVHVRAGTYDEQLLVSPSFEGHAIYGESWDAPVTVKAMQLSDGSYEKVIMRPSAYSGRLGVWSIWGPIQYLVVEGFEIDGTDLPVGMFAFDFSYDTELTAERSPSHIRALNNHVYNTVEMTADRPRGLGGFYITRGGTISPPPMSDIQIIGNLIETSGIFEDHEFYAGGASNVLIERNTIVDSRNGIIKLYDYPGTNYTIRYNVVRNSHAGIHWFNNYGHEIHGNLLYDLDKQSLDMRGKCTRPYPDAWEIVDCPPFGDIDTGPGNGARGGAPFFMMAGGDPKIDHNVFYNVGCRDNCIGDPDHAVSYIAAGYDFSVTDDNPRKGLAVLEFYSSSATDWPGTEILNNLAGEWAPRVNAVRLGGLSSSAGMLSSNNRCDRADAGSMLCEAGTSLDGVFIDLAGRDFNLAEDSPAIDAGAIIPGRQYNGSAPDLGPFEAPVFVAGGAVIDAGDPAVVQVTLENNKFPELQPACGCTGFTVRVNAESRAIVDCTRVASDRFALKLADPVVAGDVVTIEYDRSTGNVTDSAAIGGRRGANLNSKMRSFGPAEVVNNVSR